MHSLRHYLDRIHPLSPQAWSDLAVITSARSVAAGQLVLRAGDVATRIFFVKSGMLREYYVDHQGKEATRRFCRTGEFSGSLADLLAQGPSAVFIETMEACELIELDFKRVDALSLEHPSLMLLLRRLAEGLYVHKMRREFEMLTLPAAERYLRFAAHEPALDACLPRHMVASYLGITPVHLSRICAAQRSPRSTAAQPRKT